jgi:hypothetical protein
MVADGGAPVFGLLPVSSAWASMFDRQPAEVFDACVDMSIATAMLEEFARRCGERDRACIVRKYAEALQFDEFADEVITELRANGEAGQRPVRAGVIVTEAALRSPIVVESDAVRDWGADQLVVPVAVQRPATAPGAAKPTKAPTTPVTEQPPRGR